MLRYWVLNETGASCEKIFGLSCNYWQNILSNKKKKKIKQTWASLENFDICFCVSFDHYYEKSNFGEETGH